jgi:hypothetical protein
MFYIGYIWGVWNGLFQFTLFLMGKFKLKGEPSPGTGCVRSSTFDVPLYSLPVSSCFISISVKGLLLVKVMRTNIQVNRIIRLDGNIGTFAGEEGLTA